MRKFVLAVIGAACIVAPAGLATAEAGATTAAAHAVAVNWPVVKQGARGERVRVIQYLLNARGVHVVIDGVFGRATTTAVKAFQRARHLVVDGHVGSATWQRLIVTIRRGSRGNAVRAAQHQLRFQYGYTSLKVDGVFGKSTEAAVKNFQSRRRLRVDGIVGLGTWKAMEA